MAHTERIYNNPRIHKAQRYNLDDKTDLHPVLGSHVNRQVGIPLTKRSWLCMGKCPQCRDPNREPRKLRNQRKEEFRHELELEAIDG